MTIKNFAKQLSIPSAVIFSLFSLLFGSVPTATAQDGPPMLTEDAGTPGDGQWAITILTTYERDRDDTVFEAPLLEINYGIGYNFQLTFEAAWVIKRETDGPAKTGLGNSSLGLKWRFLDEERHGFDMSVYPQLEFNNPTRSVERGLADRGLRLFLPVAVEKQWGPFVLNAEAGYEIVQHGPDEVDYGLAIERQLTRKFSLAVELHVSALKNMQESELIFNAGSRFQLNRNLAVLASAGRTLRQPGTGGPSYLASAGVQFNFGNSLLTADEK
jgi:hypothetical protein